MSRGFHGRAYERYFTHRETDPHSGTKKIQRYEKRLFRTAVMFSLPFRTAVIFSLPFRTLTCWRYEKLQILSVSDTRIRVFIGLQVGKSYFAVLNRIIGEDTVEDPIISKIYWK